MNAYLASVIENVKKKHGNEPEFVQTVEEVLTSLEPVIEKHPEYEKVDLLNRMVEPERMFTFRVTWQDDEGKYHTLPPAARPAGPLGRRGVGVAEERPPRHHQVPGL